MFVSSPMAEGGPYRSLRPIPVLPRTAPIILPGQKSPAEPLSRSVPNFVPSGRLDGLSSKLGRNAKTSIVTSESERIQTPLKC